jgi:hypothetical protein
MRSGCAASSRDWPYAWRPNGAPRPMRSAGLGNASTTSKVDIQSYLSINERFHACLLELANSFVVRRALEHVCSLPFASPNAFVMAQREVADIRDVVFMAQQQHRSILEAIENREGARAEAMAREHAELSLNAMGAILQVPETLHKVPGLRLLAGNDRQEETPPPPSHRPKRTGAVA